MSGRWRRGKVGTVGHRQTKGPATVMPHLNYRATSRLYSRLGAKVVSHAKYIVFQLAVVPVPRQLFAAIVERIGRLRLACASG